MRVRNTNCYLCETQMPENKAVRRPKSKGGDILLLCVNCNKETFKKKKKLIRRV